MPGIINHMVYYSVIFCVMAKASSTKPQLQLEPEQTVYIFGEAISFRCQADSPSMVISYSFYKDGSLLTNSSTNTFQIPKLTLLNSGIYFCTYYKISTTSTESNFVKLNIVDRPGSPTISIEPKSSIHFIGQKVIVRCLLQSTSGVTAISLYQNGNEISESDNFGVLTFERIVQRNAGNYSCAFSIQISGRKVMSQLSIDRTLIVTESLPVPTLSFDPINPQSAGQQVQVICQTPFPSTIHSYRFYQNGREVTEKSGSRSSVYVLQSYHSNLEGCYFCKTYRIEQGVEVSSFESPQQYLTEKITGGRQCDNMSKSEYNFLSHQGLKLYGSVLLGKLIVFIAVIAAFGIQLLLIKIRNQKAVVGTVIQTE